jgi:hypothetical protein
MRKLRTTLVWCAIVLAALWPATVRAQTASDRLNERARVHLDALTFDTAYVLLDSALRLATTPAQRLRSFTLLGFTQLGLLNKLAARQAFELALRIDPNLRIDSLDLHTDAPAAFALARTSVAAQATTTVEQRRVLLLTVIVPDTVVAPADARVPVIVQPNAVSRTITTIFAVEQPNVPVWADTQTTVGRHRLAWSLRRTDGTLWPEGRYLLRAQAVDSNGQATPFEERILRISRVPVDTQAYPAMLPASAFAPEMLPAARFTGPKLLVGSAMALLVAATPSMLGSSELNAGLPNDPTSYAIAGGVALGSLIGFVKGRRPQPIRQNILKNKTLRDSDQKQRDAIGIANAEARGKAPIRIAVERLP